MTTTTGSSIGEYLAWIEGELAKRQYGEVAIRFKVHAGQVVDVRRESVDCDHFTLEEKS
jgi:hypothetical protein